MQYASVIRGQFCSRPNRFLAVVRIGGQEEIVHVKNTGRCRELLIPECTVYLSRSDNPNRKTKYDLIAVEKQREGKPPLLINLDSQIPNAAAADCSLRTPYSAVKSLTAAPASISPSWTAISSPFWRSRALRWNRTALHCFRMPRHCGVSSICRS